MKDAIPPTSSAAPICLIPFLKISIPVGAIDPVELKLAVRVNWGLGYHVSKSGQHA
jgi:hypothetical protein